MSKEKEVKIIFLGGAGTVTGSKIIVQLGQRHILVDAGLFQGLKELRMLNWEPLPFNIHKLDAILLTHAHLDHVGYMPMLTKSGYRGKILATPPTCELSRVILMDSARLQEEEAEQANEMGYSKHKPAKPLYTTQDALQCLKHFSDVPDNKWISLSDDTRFRFLKSGHILGSCMIELEYMGKIIFFSGDIGKRDPLILNPAERIHYADYVVLESTYGNRIHREDNPEIILAKAINDTLQRGGNLIIPSFAIERAQEVIYLINCIKRKNMIPDVPVYLDSPMALDASEIFCRYSEWHKLSFQESFNMFEQVTMIRDIKSTMRNIENPIPKIIISGSGMLTGGRVLEYLKAYVQDKKNMILFVGYQAEGTRGRSILNKEPEIKIHGQFYKVAIEARELHGMSGHADQDDLLDWLKNIKNKPKKIFLNHGETESANALREKIMKTFGWDTIIAQMHAEYIMK
ncbi:MAG: MBL fold metallo-hydrolase [Cytophagaceae bacterium]|nr:MBL fold metallo-hydrolase [Cytophagaceae bacterium]MDW8455203.1 MBL fold metallo-hydrolase [Cytophagaceae bacterium]